MRKKTLLLILMLVITTFGAFSQIAFTTEYGGAFNEDGRWMEQMPDSGFIMTGGTTTYSNGQTDIWLVRTDKYGNTQWTKSIGGAFFDFANMVKPVSNGLVICGVTNRNGNDDAIITKTDLSGNNVWTTVLGDSMIQWFEGLTPTSDGGYAAVGVNTGAGTHGTYDIWLVKFNSAGVKQWEKSIGGQSYEIGNSIQETPDGGFIISGQTYSYGNFDGDFYLVKTNSAGVVQWQQTYGQPHLQECHYAQCTPDGGYILVGDADTLSNGFGDTDIWLFKTDSLGAIQWEKIYGGSKKDGGKTVENTSDGGFIIAGITRSFGLINPNYYLIKTDGQGALEWQKTNYGTTYHDHAYRGIETSDAGFAELGFFKNSSGYQNFALVKLGPNGGIVKDLAVDEITAPRTTICRSNGVPISVRLTNYGATNEQNIIVNVAIDNGNASTILTDTFVGTLAPTASTTLNFTPTYDFNLNGIYNIKAYVIHRNGDISYANDTTLKTVTVLAPTADPTTVSAVSCTNSPLTLSSIPAAATDSMFWFDAAVNGEMISSGNTYTTPTLSSTTTYYVQSAKGKGSKVGALDNSIGAGSTSSGNYLKFDARVAFTLVSVKVYPTSAGNRTIELRNSSGTVLQSKIVNLPSAPGGMRVYLNFSVPQANDLQLNLNSNSTSLMRNSAGAVFPYEVSQTISIYGTNSSNPGTYYYFYDWYIFVPGQNCASNLKPVQGIIGSGATTAFDGSRCGNGTVTLNANSSGTITWYDAASGGNLLYTGNSYTTPSLNATTTYYVESSSCSNRIAVNAIVNTQSSAPTASDVTHCGPGTVTLTASGSSPISWYNAPVNGTLIGTGNSFTTPYLNATSTYYVSAGSACPSNVVSVNAIIDAANPPTVTGTSACGPASVALTASSPDPVRWYTVATGGSPVSTSSTYNTPVLSVPTTYYVEAGNVCSSARVPVLANVTVTDPPIGTNGSRCGAGHVVISAQSLNQVTWWTSLTGGTQVGSGLTFTTPTINSTTTYYAQATGGGCNSVRTQIVATVNITTPPNTTSATRCGTGTVVLHAASSDTIYWYSASTGGSPLGNGTSFTTPSISTTTTYYAQASLGCPSSRASVDAIVNIQSADPVTTSASNCGTGTVTLSAVSADPVTWYDAPTGGNVVGTGNTLVTPSISTTTTYYAIAGISSCASNAVPAVATINSVPTNPFVTNAQSCGPGQLTLTAVSPDTLKWYTLSTGGTVLTTGPSYSAAFSSTTTVYVEATNGICKSIRIPVTASIYNIPTVNLGPAVVNINAGQSITLDAGAGFTTYQWSTSATTQTISVNTGGVYFVTATDIHTCSATDTITVNVSTVGISENELDRAIEIYPNPSNGNFNIKVNNSSIRFDLQITDITGRTVISDSHKNNSLFDKNYDLTGFVDGIYYLRIISSNGETTRPIIIR